MTIPTIDRRPVYLIWGEHGRVSGVRDLKTACRRAKPSDTIGIWSVDEHGNSTYELKLPGVDHV